VHPIERLRLVAHAGGEPPALVAGEAAAALASMAADPAALVTACRRLLDRRPTCGPMWWLAARVLAAADPEAEAWRAARALDRDPTPAALAAALPDDAAVAVLGWPEQVGEALRRRGDLRVLVVDAEGAGGGLAAWLRRSGVDAEVVAEAGLGAAVAASDLVVLEALAAGPPGLVATAGSRAAAAVARAAGTAVWAAAGVGRVLPAPLWSALAARLAAAGPAWDQPEEVVPLALVDRVAGPGGPPVPAAEAVARPDCTAVPELAR
jgi:hypothetical protein